MNKGLFLFFIFLAGYHTARSRENNIINLRCEHLVSPIGIDSYHPRLSWQTEKIRKQTAYQVCLSTDSSAIWKEHTASWLSGKIPGQDIMMHYEGTTLKPFTKYFWAVKIWDEEGNEYKSNTSYFETGMMEVSNWKGSWITDGHDVNEKRSASFRKNILLTKKIAEARMYIATGGFYESFLNGTKIGNHRLDPAFTRYDRRILYVTHDITNQLQPGENTVSVILGNGWFNHQPTAVWFFDEASWRARPKFCMDIKITYTDGTKETIVTDSSWKCAFNEIIRNNIFTGEFHDARLSQPGWMYHSFKDTAWKPASYTSTPSQHIVSQVMPPVRDIDTIRPASIKQLNNLTYIYDLGVNISGVTELKINGPRGAKIRLIHGERLDSLGRVDRSNIDYHYRPKQDSDPFQEDQYILSGEGEEVFRPLFNYKGFQYVQVESDTPLKIGKDNLLAYFMHSDVSQNGFISSSSLLLNKIWEATNRSYLSNLFGYPTDCPQREKNGWTGDAHIAIETGLYNYDAITIYEKWMADHRDEQQPNGMLPAIIPTAMWGYQWANGPDWTSTIAIIPWNIYLFYGDKTLLETCYPAIKRYVDYITSVSKNGLTDWGLGDWIPIKCISNKEFVTSIYYCIDAQILARTAQLLGHSEDAEKYSTLYNIIKNAINNTFLDRETGIYCSGFQTEQSMPLFWGIVPDDLKNKVAGSLAKRIALDGQLDVGLLGSKSILNALSENGYADLAYQLASGEKYPSWGWWIKNGATTLYENWQIKGNADISLNHIMFGEISAWYYKCLGGIFPDETAPGFKHIILKPNFVKGLEQFEAKHLSPYGWIISKWTKRKGTVIYEVEIPSNSTATLYLPGNTNGKKEIQLDAGKYNFTVKNNR